MNWLNKNELYWDNVAKEYSNLYTNNWSILENDYIYEQIKFINEIGDCNLLDLGCGAGLGYLLSRKAQPEINYTGVDISRYMLDSINFKNPNLRLIQSSMSNLSMIKTNTIDVVISIFTAFSFTDDIEKTMSEIKRVLKPGGKIFISVLSKFSLRRIFNLRWGNQEKYRTRGSQNKNFSYAWVFSKFSLKKLFQKNNFKISKISGYNILAGFKFLEKREKLWNTNVMLSNLIPNLSHEIFIKGELQANNSKK
jgi:ubiquinone/menaquinone biosynthesis C-methylase UbiE